MNYHKSEILKRVEGVQALLQKLTDLSTDVFNGVLSGADVTTANQINQVNSHIADLHRQCFALEPIVRNHVEKRTSAERLVNDILQRVSREGTFKDGNTDWSPDLIKSLVDIAVGQ